MDFAKTMQSFFKTFKESLAAYFFDFGGIIAGFLLASQFGIFQILPWIIAVYPAVLSGKGMIMGLLSGRLSTALHIGTIYPKFFGNTKSFYQLLQSIIVITLIASVAMSLMAGIFGSLLWGISFADFSDVLFVVISTMTLGLLILLITVSVAFTTFKKELDPDIMVYPIMSTIADIGITTCYITVLSLFFLFGNFGRCTVMAIAVVPTLLTIYILIQNIRSEEFTKTVKESCVTLIFVVFIVNITGTVLGRISGVVADRKEIFTVYPALIDTIGDVGSVVGSTATTKLALGLLKPTFKSIRNHTTQIFSAWAASIIIFVLLAVVSLVANRILELQSFIHFSTLLLAANLIAVAIIVWISYGVSIMTFKRGLDPDNFVVPIESSLADSIMSIALLIVLLVAG